MRPLLFFLVLSMGIAQSGSVEAKSCFCKALCFFENKDSADFSMSQDVSCDLSLSEKKATLLTDLKLHMAAEHSQLRDEDISKHTKVTCYEISAKK